MLTGQMFQRKGGGSLPTTMGMPSTMGGMGDGSGRAIKMDAPVVKAWKKASSFTKYSYYILLFCLLMVFMGFRYLRFWNASIWLTCHATECTLELTPPGSRTQKLVFPRSQLHSAQAIKTDRAGNFLSVDTSKYEPPKRKKGKKDKYKSGSYKGPDEKGEFKSYSIKFFARKPEDVQKGEEEVPEADFSALSEFLVKERLEDETEVYALHMRKFGLSQSRTRVRSMVNKVESYKKRRRQKLILKESATLPWQGILLLIFGLLGFMLTLLIGQFWEEAPKRQGGPGARRQAGGSMRKNSQYPSFVVDTGRPSKLPPGYKNY